jgi:hypothetical protein
MLNRFNDFAMLVPMKENIRTNINSSKTDGVTNGGTQKLPPKLKIVEIY